MAEPTRSHRRTPRAVVVGSGPNGLTAAARLARAGWDVQVFERSSTLGGAAASADVLGPGTTVDLGAAGHPFGVVSPAFRALGLTERGVEWAHAPLPLAHPLEGRSAAVLHRSLAETARDLDGDARAWTALHRPLVEHLDAQVENILGPLLRIPPRPVQMARFGLRAPWSARSLGRTLFRDEPARALLAGSAAHAIVPPGLPLTAAFGLIFGAIGMKEGWPAVRGGTGRITQALAQIILEHAGAIHLDQEITDLAQLPPADAVILNLTPRQVLALDGVELTSAFRASMRRWRYGTGSSKVDYLLDGPIPWADPRVAGAGTVHVVGTVDELQQAEVQARAGRLPDRPFVMVCQQQAADPSRATGPAEGATVVWTYAHVPAGCDAPVEGLIEAQIERFAPGFRDRILRRVATPPSALEHWNPNLVGGDVGGGAMDGLQQVLRPGLTLHPHRTGTPGLYLASGSTAPGGGVHGMGGWWAAGEALTGLRSD